MHNQGRTTRLGKAIAVGMVIYLVLLGVMSVGVFRISSCLNGYITAAAISTNARAELAAQDRKLDLDERALTEADRQANRAFDAALGVVLTTLANGSEREKREAYDKLLAQRVETNRTLTANDKARASIQSQRATNEETRKQNPPPPVPTASC